MTVNMAYFTHTGGVCLFADTITSYKGIRDEGSLKRTSQGELLVPTTHNGHVITPREDACKIGIYKNDLIYCASGDVRLIREIIKLVRTGLDELREPLQLTADTLLSVLSGKELCGKLNDNANVLFAYRNSDGVFATACQFDIVRDNNLKIEHRKAGKEHRGSRWTSGSGKSHFDCFPPYDRFSWSMRDQRWRLIPCISAFMSHQAITINAACAYDFGGTFLGIGIEQDGIVVPRDYLVLCSDQSNKIRALNKVMFRNDTYIVTEFINKRINVFGLLQGKPKREGQEKWGNLDQLYWEEAVQFQADSLFSLKSRCVNSLDCEMRGLSRSDGRPIIAACVDSNGVSHLYPPCRGDSWIDLAFDGKEERFFFPNVE